MKNNSSQESVKLYLSAEQDCSYLQDQQSQSIFIDPDKEMTVAFYANLLQQGFRRSGSYIYQPHCKTCHSCVSVRLDVQKFALSRSQKRCRNKNKSLIVTEKKPEYNEAQYQMYADYVTSRHAGGGMDEPDSKKYLEFLTSSWSDTVFFEFSENNRLVALAATDIVNNGFSAVYTFFDPSNDYQKRSLGVNSIIWQAKEARRLGLQWLYLGYWIKDCPKMSYKNKYQPLEYFYNNSWQKKPPE